MTTLSFKQLNTILNVLQSARREQATVTWQHDKVVKDSLNGNPEVLAYLADQQDANYKLKESLDHSFYAIEEIIREYK